MKFNGKELFELGVPQNKIKFFIGREFNSKDELLKELRPKETIQDDTFTWVDWLWFTFSTSHMPMRMNGNHPEAMSKSELKRLFDSNSIQINYKYFKSTDECRSEEFPITQFVWFPNGKRKTTWL